MLLYYHKFFVNARLFPKLFLIFFLRKIPIFREKNFQQIISNKPAPAPTSESTERQSKRKPTPTRAISPTTKHQQAPATLRKHYSKKTLSKYGNNSKNFNHIQTSVHFKEPTLQYQYFEQIL